MKAAEVCATAGNYKAQSAVDTPTLPGSINDENIRLLAFRLERAAMYIERYPCRSSLVKMLPGIKLLVEALENENNQANPDV